MATSRPPPGIADEFEFGPGRRLARKSSTRLCGDRGGRHRVVAGDHDGLDAHARISAKRSDAALSRRPSVHHTPRVLPHRRRPGRAARRETVDDLAGARRGVPPIRDTYDLDRVRRTLRICRPVRVRHPLIDAAFRVAVNGTKVAGLPSNPAACRSRMLYFRLASTTMLRPSGVFVRQGSDRAASAVPRLHVAHGTQTPPPLPVAEGDGAGLVEQQHVDVARGFHRASGWRSRWPA